MNGRVLNTHSKGERVKIPLLPKQGKIKGAGQRQWSRQIVTTIKFFSKLSYLTKCKDYYNKSNQVFLKTFVIIILLQRHNARYLSQHGRP